MSKSKGRNPPQDKATIKIIKKIKKWAKCGGKQIIGRCFILIALLTFEVGLLFQDFHCSFIEVIGVTLYTWLSVNVGTSLIVFVTLTIQQIQKCCNSPSILKKAKLWKAFKIFLYLFKLAWWIIGIIIIFNLKSLKNCTTISIYGISQVIGYGYVFFIIVFIFLLQLCLWKLKKNNHNDSNDINFETNFRIPPPQIKSHPNTIVANQRMQVQMFQRQNKIPIYKEKLKDDRSQDLHDPQKSEYNSVKYSQLSNIGIHVISKQRQNIIPESRKIIQKTNVKPKQKEERKTSKFGLSQALNNDFNEDTEETDMEASEPIFPQFLISQPPTMQIQKRKKKKIYEEVFQIGKDLDSYDKMR